MRSVLTLLLTAACACGDGGGEHANERSESIVGGPQPSADSAVAVARLGAEPGAAECSPPRQLEWYEADPDQERFVNSGQQWGSSERAIARQLGSPLKVTIDTTRNRHTDSLDQIRHVHYAGIAFHIYRVVESQRDILFRLVVDSSAYRFAFGLGVGTGWSEVLACLGDPATTEQIASDSMLLSYRVGELEELVQLWTSRDTVRRIVWNFYID